MFLSKEQTVKLLGRSLSTAEDTNYDLYLKIAIQRLEELLCIQLCKADGERTYSTRYGYRTVYIDPFIDVVSVTIDGNTVDTGDYMFKQNDRFNGDWYNIIEFTRKRQGENVVIDAEWGFNSLPMDLQLLLAKLFDQGTVELTDDRVKSKKIEDFNVTFKDAATYEEFVANNSATIDKYSQCNEGIVRHGSVRGYYESLYPIRSY